MLWPDQTYRLRVTTELDLQGGGLLAEQPKLAPLALVEDAFFATAGPPGTSAPSAPATASSQTTDQAAPTPQPGAPSDLELPPAAPPSEAIVRVLSGLSAYVARTIPAPIALPTPTQLAASPGRYDGIDSVSNATFAADDVCVEFGTDTVQSMYRLARRDLALTLVGPDGATLSPPGLPPGSRGGRFGTWLASEGPSDPTKPVPSIKLDAAWADKVKDYAKEMGVDPNVLRERDALSMPGLLLPVGARCEARLLPLLLRETFAPRPETELPSMPGTFSALGLPSGWADVAPIGSDAAWWRIDAPASLAAQLEAEVVDVVAAAGNVGELAESHELDRPGAALVWTGVRGPGGALLDDPAQWRDVRVSAWLQPTANGGTLGLVARRNVDGTAMFRLELDCDRAEVRCLRADGNATALLGLRPFAVIAGRPLLLSFEVRDQGEATSLRAWVDDILLLELQDGGATRPVAGSVALWRWRQQGLICADLQVEQLDPDVTPVLKFPVPVAPAASLGDLLDSHDGLASRLHAETQPPALPGLNWGEAITPNEVNNWLYPAAILPSPQSQQSLAPPDDAESQACASLLERLRSLNLELALPLERLRVSTFSVQGAVDGVLLESPVQLDWRRTSLTAMAFGTATARQWQAPTRAAITDVRLGPASEGDTTAATIRLREDTDLAGMVLERQTVGDLVLRAGVPAPLWTMPSRDARSGPLWNLSPGPTALVSVEVDAGAEPSWTAASVGLVGKLDAASKPGVAWLKAPAIAGLRLIGTASLIAGGEAAVVLRDGGGGAGKDAPNQLIVRLSRPQGGATLAIDAFEPSAAGDQTLANDLAASQAEGLTLVPAGASFGLEILALGAQLAVCIDGKLVWASQSVRCCGPGRIGLELLQGVVTFAALELATLGPWISTGGGAGGSTAADVGTLLELDDTGAWQVIRQQGVGPFAIRDGVNLTQPSRWTLTAGRLQQSRPLQTDAGAGGSACSYAVLPQAASASDVRVSLRCGSDPQGAVGVALRWQGPDNHVAVLLRSTPDGGAVVAVTAVEDGSAKPLTTVEVPAAPSATNVPKIMRQLQVRSRGERVLIWLDGALVCETSVPASFGSGVALIAADGAAAEFADVVVWPLALQERALAFSAPLYLDMGPIGPGFANGGAVLLGQSRGEAVSGLPGSSKGWATDGARFYPKDGAAQRQLLTPVADLSALCISVGIELQAGGAAVVLASTAAADLALELDRSADEDATFEASWRLRLRQFPPGKSNGTPAKPKSFVLATGAWQSCPDESMRWTVWTHDGRLRGCVDGAQALDLDLSTQPALSALLAGAGHVGVGMSGGGAGAVFRDFAVWRSWDVGTGAADVRLANGAAGAVNGGAISVPTWDGSKATKAWSAPTDGKLVDGGVVALVWERLDKVGVDAQGETGQLWLGMQAQDATSARVELRLAGLWPTPTLCTVALSEETPNTGSNAGSNNAAATATTLWAADAGATAERNAQRGVLVFRRRSDVLELLQDGEVVAEVQVALPTGEPWVLVLGRVGHAPAVITSLQTEAPSFAAIARCAARSAPAPRGASVAVGPADAAASAGQHFWASDAPNAPPVPWQEQSMVRLRLRDSGGRTLHDAAFVAASSQSQALAYKGSTMPTRVLRSADGTRLFALSPTTGGTTAPLAGAETLRLGLRRVRDPATFADHPAYAAEMALESSDGHANTVEAATLLRIVTPPPIALLSAEDVTITPSPPTALPTKP